MQEESVLSNQTQFSLEEPYRFSADTSSEKSTQDAVAPKKKNKTLLIIGGTFTLIIVLLILLIMAKPSPEQQILVPPEASPVVTTKEQDPLLQRINRLSSELEDADPVKQSLLFPPVDLDIRLDPAQK